MHHILRLFVCEQRMLTPANIGLLKFLKRLNYKAGQDFTCPCGLRRSRPGWWLHISRDKFAVCRSLAGHHVRHYRRSRQGMVRLYLHKEMGLVGLLRYDYRSVGCRLVHPWDALRKGIRVLSALHHHQAMASNTRMPWFLLSWLMCA